MVQPGLCRHLLRLPVARRREEGHRRPLRRPRLLRRRRHRRRRHRLERRRAGGPPHRGRGLRRPAAPQGGDRRAFHAAVAAGARAALAAARRAVVQVPRGGLHGGALCGRQRPRLHRTHDGRRLQRAPRVGRARRRRRRQRPALPARVAGRAATRARPDEGGHVQRDGGRGVGRGLRRRAGAAEQARVPGGRRPDAGAERLRRAGRVRGRGDRVQRVGQRGGKEGREPRAAGGRDPERVDGRADARLRGAGADVRAGQEVGRHPGQPLGLVVRVAHHGDRRAEPGHPEGVPEDRRERRSLRGPFGEAPEPAVAGRDQVLQGQRQPPERVGRARGQPGSGAHAERLDVAADVLDVRLRADVHLAPRAGHRRRRGSRSGAASHGDGGGRRRDGGRRTGVVDVPRADDAASAAAGAAEAQRKRKEPPQVVRQRDAGAPAEDASCGHNRHHGKHHHRCRCRRLARHGCARGGPREGVCGAVAGADGGPQEGKRQRGVRAHGVVGQRHRVLVAREHAAGVDVHHAALDGLVRARGRCDHTDDDDDDVVGPGGRAGVDDDADHGAVGRRSEHGGAAVQPARRLRPRRRHTRVAGRPTRPCVRLPNRPVPQTLDGAVRGRARHRKYWDREETQADSAFSPTYPPPLPRKRSSKIPINATKKRHPSLFRQFHLL
eukprot:Rhum_TRINITY_DN10916_c1_g1::Rhum_TRINITY_DN10916_c1_g1_i1::g.41390::m.41390